MKLTLLALLLTGGVAAADDYSGPPGGYDDPAGVQVDYRPQPQRPQPPQRRAEHQPLRQEVRQLLLERFDQNGDGRLEPRERRQAARALRKLARRIARQDRREARLGKIIQRYDLNHDGNVDAGEMPPAVARRLRQFDRNGDGWVDPQELPR